MGNTQDNTITDGFIGLAYVSEAQGEKESHVQTFDSISWASRAIIDGFTDKTNFLVSELPDGDFSSAEDPGVGDSGWVNGGPDTAEHVTAYKDYRNVMHLKEAGSTFKGITSAAKTLEHSLEYDASILIYVVDAGTGNLVDNLSIYWNTGSGNNDLDNTEWGVGRWIKVERTGNSHSGEIKHLNCLVRNGAEIYIAEFTALLTNRLVLKDLRGEGNGISPNGSGISTTYTYRSKNYLTHPVPEADLSYLYPTQSGLYIDRAVVLSDFTLNGLSNIVIKTNFHGDPTKDYEWYNSVTGVNRLGQEITTSGINDPWLPASGQNMQIIIDIISTTAGAGGTVHGAGVFAGPSFTNIGDED